jgi:alpha-ketoglutarate-dependent taurine dioxygenase
MHHEMSYAVESPGTMIFACLTAPTSGGATGVADAGAVLQALPRDLVSRFDREGWLLVRTYNDEIGASWEEAFGTADRRAVEERCRARGIEFSWQDDGVLRTRQRRRAVVRHPVTGALSWFNQIAFLNEWTLDAEVREFLLDMYGPEGLPFTTFFGDGGPVGRDVVELINGVYAQLTLREPWQDGDLLLVDNLRSAHSREAYEGPRDVRVGMTDPVHVAQVPPDTTAVAR